MFTIVVKLSILDVCGSPGYASTYNRIYIKVFFKTFFNLNSHRSIVKFMIFVWHLKQILLAEFFFFWFSLPRPRNSIHVFYFTSNSIFGFRLELLRSFLVFSFKVAYELFSIILDNHVFYEYTLYTSLSVMVV